MLQAFIDESEGLDGTFVLAGHVAPRENWVLFSAEWEKMLGRGVRDRSGEFHFKMNEMASSAERLERAAGFYRLIEKYVYFSISCRVNRNELARAGSRIFVPFLSIDWGFARNPYLVAFRCMMDGFHSNADLNAGFSDVFPDNVAVDFIFDQRSEKKIIVEGWNNYIAARAEGTRQRYGAVPKFVDDKEYLPLQAADFWAWWVQKWYSEGHPGRMEYPDFGPWSAKRDRFLKIDISYDEDQLVEAFKGIIAENIEPGRFIFDNKGLFLKRK